MGVTNADRAALEHAKLLYAKALNQTQSSFNGQTTAVQPAQGTGQQATADNAAEWAELEDFRNKARQSLEAGEMTEAEYDQMMDIADEWESQLLGKGDTELQHSISDGNTLDNYGISNENSVTDDSMRGENYDNSRVREGTAEDTRNDGADRRTDPNGIENSRASAEWRNQPASVQRVVRKTVNNHIKQSNNGNEIYAMLCAYVGKSDADMSYYSYRKAVGILTEKIFNDAVSMHPVLFENRWSFMGGSITSLYRSVNEAVSTGQNIEERQYSISDTSSKQDVVSGLRDILRRGGDVNELRQYVAQVERNAPRAERNAPRADQNTREAEHILESAKQQGISVEEYLSQNWELYETENGWDPAARKALELEKGDNRQYSINPTFGNEIDSWNRKDAKTFLVGRTSDALKSIGVADRDIIWHSGKINSILEKHSGMTLEVIKQVPEILEHPVVVLDSKSFESRLVIFGTVNDSNGVPVTAILELQPTTKGGELLDMNVVASAYGKDSGAANLIRNSGLVYLDPNRNRTESWMQGLGLQLPSDTNALDSVGNVTYIDGKVKIKSVPYSQYMLRNNGKSDSKKQYSVGDTQMEEQKTQSDTPTAREQLPRKAQEYLKRAERKLLRDLAGAFSYDQTTGISGGFFAQ